MENLSKYENFLHFSKPLEKFILIEVSSSVLDEPETIKEKIIEILKNVYCGFILFAFFITLPNFINKTYYQIQDSANFDIDMFANGFTISISILIVGMKFLVIYRNKKKIFKIIQVLTKTYPTDPKEVSRIERYGRNFHKFHKYFAYYIYSTALLGLIPLINFLWSGEKRFAFDIEYPVDKSITSHYLAAYFYSIFSSVYSYSILITGNLKINGLMILSALAFHDLKSKFDTLRTLTDKDELQKSLISFIERHCELDETIHEIQELLAPIFSVMFIFTSFEACLTAFQCSVTTEATKFIFNVTFFSLLFIWIVLQSLFGQMLKDSHNALLESIYNCEWEQKADIKFRKSLILLLAKTQKQEVFKIAKIVDISLENVTSVSIDLSVLSF
ncbi:hypothetical protein ACKWTF_004598 [Chironomus riparius]